MTTATAASRSQLADVNRDPRCVMPDGTDLSIVWHDCALAGCIGGHEAYRHWLVDPDQQWPLGSPYVITQQIADLLEHGYRGTTQAPISWPEWQWPPGLLDARCTEDHNAPDEDCGCGLRVLGSLSDLASAVLAEYRLRATLPQELSHLRWPRDYLDRIAIGSVVVAGRVLREGSDDPAGTLRVSACGVTGPLHLPATLGHAAEAIAAAYGIDPADVHIGTSTGPRWVGSFLSEQRKATCQACGIDVNPRKTPGLCNMPNQCSVALSRRLRRPGARL